MFSTPIASQKTIDELLLSGIQQKDIIILNPQKNIRKKDEPDFVHAQPTSLIAGALIGSVVGFILLGLVGFFIGLNSKQVVQFGEITLINQSVFPTLLATTVTGAILGVILGAASGTLAGIGIPKVVRHRYKFYLKEGGLLLTVKVADNEEPFEIINLLKKTGAQDVAVLLFAK